MHPSDDGGSFVPPSATPRRVTGGIRLQSRRGGTSWWSRRWLAAFEAAAVGERHAQGLDDARRGQVLDAQVVPGGVQSRVQGSRTAPHDVSMSLAPLEQTTLLRIAAAIASRGVSRAELLAGEMPDDVEAVFRREGGELFPRLEDDLELHCSCGDWSQPCRHAIASALVVSELLEHEPLLAFRMRGIEPDVLRTLVAGSAELPSADGSIAASAHDAPAQVDVAAFWGVARDVDLPIALDAPAMDAPLVRILGAPPRWRGADTFEPAMRRIYAQVAGDGRTVDLALRSPGDG